MLESLDVRTLLIVLAIVRALQAAGLIYLWRIHKQYWPARNWAIGSVLIAVGALLVASRAQLSTSWEILVANTFVIVGVLTFNAGIVQVMTAKGPWRLGAAFAGVALFAQAWFTIADPSVAARTEVFTVFAIGCKTYAAASVLRAPRGPLRSTQLLIAGVIIIEICVLILSGIGDIQAGTSSPLHSTAPRVLFLLTFIATGVFLAIALAILTAQRTHALLEETARLHRRSELNLAAALKHMSQGLTMFDKDERLVVSNERYAQMYELPSMALEEGRTFRDILELRKRAGTFSSDIETYVAGLRRELDLGKEMQATTALPGGKIISVVNRPMDGGGWVATHDDITERTRSEHELSNLKSFLDTIIDNVPVPVVVKDPQTLKFILVNRAYSKFMGISRDRLIGTTVHDHFKPSVASLISEFDLEALRDHDRPVSSEFALETIANELRTVTTTRTVVRDHDGHPKYLIAVIEDVTDKRMSEAKIARLAHYDSLTGLANRALFMEKFSDSLARVRRHGSRFALFLLDLDQFKATNDTLGHHVGDALLKELSLRLKSSLREVDVAARLGGDEFALLVEAGEHDLKEGAITLAARLLEVISAPYAIGVHTVNIGASIGIALAPQDSTDADELMKYADLAMYKAKAEGRNDYRFFSADMDLEAQARRTFEMDLRSAVSDHQFEIHYQPIMELRTGKIACIEALVRWQHPQRGLLAPDQFIAAAEESGLIVPIGEWVLRKACRDAVEWPVDIKVSVNLSSIQFQKANLVDIVLHALSDTGLSPNRLELEITESVMLERSETNISTLHQLRALGIGIVLDDFGTGFSSLLYVQQFPFDKIKIDRSFVKDLARNTNSAAIVCAVNGLAKALNIVTVAEGVETQDQFELLRVAGCDQVQGYLFYRPVLASELRFTPLDQATTSATAAA